MAKSNITKRIQLMTGYTLKYKHKITNKYVSTDKII